MCDSRGWKRNVEIFIDSVLETEEEKGKRERDREKVDGGETGASSFSPPDENGEENGWFSQALS